MFEEKWKKTEQGRQALGKGSYDFFSSMCGGEENVRRGEVTGTVIWSRRKWTVRAFNQQKIRRGKGESWREQKGSRVHGKILKRSWRKKKKPNAALNLLFLSIFGGNYHFQVWLIEKYFGHEEIRSLSLSLSLTDYPSSHKFLVLLKCSKYFAGNFFASLSLALLRTHRLLSPVPLITPSFILLKHNCAFSWRGSRNDVYHRKTRYAKICISWQLNFFEKHYTSKENGENLVLSSLDEL